MSKRTYPERRFRRRAERPREPRRCTVAKGSISHIEFPADDVERAKRFYAAVAGWLFRTSETTGGGIGRRGETVGQRVRVYIDVDDLEGAVAAATANGGSVLTP